MAALMGVVGELSAREREVLAAVGRRLTNLEIAEALHISVRTVESHIAALRRKLAASSRADLVAAAANAETANVALPQNSFVGRDQEVAALTALLLRDRWVTVVGHAGAGKTRLALETAVRLTAEGGPAAALVVELASADDEQVVGRLARAVLPGTEGAGDMVAACALALQTRPHLLVVDNCDRVAGTVTSVLGRLLARAPGLRVLATSRTPVGASDETVYELAPLRVDDEGAVRLFVDRARAAAPYAVLAGDDLRTAARVCRRLDGLPLAIELAAARLRHLTIAELADQLDHGFDALGRPGPGSRHTTLEAAFGWTWDLLDRHEQAVLSRLASLPGPFDLTLAEAVTRPGSAVVVLGLLDRSLVAVDGVDVGSGRGDGARRFRLLDVLRAFVLDRTDSDVVADVRARHAALTAERLDAARRMARRDDDPTTVAAARRLVPDATAAVTWALAAGEPATALRLARALAVVAEQYGPAVDSLAAIERAARDDGVRDIARAEDLLDAGLALAYGDLDLLDELAALALSRVDGEPALLAAHLLAAYADAYRHRAESAREHVRRGLAVAERLGDAWHLGSLHQVDGILERVANDPLRALAAFERSIDAYATAGDAMHVNNVRYMMASAAAASGTRTVEALEWARECEAYARESGNRHELGHALLTRADLAGDQDVDAMLREALEIFRSCGDLRCTTRTYLALAARRPHRERVPLLREALEVATRAHDDDRRADALERLAETHWTAGDERLAAVAFGELAALVGDGEARRRSSASFTERVDTLRAAVAEGMARGARPGAQL